MQVILASVTVVALACLSLRLLRNFMGARTGSGNLEVLEAVSVGRRAQLVLVRIGRRYVVLGVSEAAIVRVAEMDDEVSQILARERPREGGGWLTVLNRFTGEGD